MDTICPDKIIEDVNILVVPSTDLGELWKNRLQGFDRYELDGLSIDSKGRFFLQASERLPQAERLKAHGSWDALSDALQDGIADRKKNVVFEWYHPEILASRDSKSFINAIETFLHAAFYLKTRNHLDPDLENLLLITILVVPQDERSYCLKLLNDDCLREWNIQVEVVGYE